jgi:hypothetical protein
LQDVAAKLGLSSVADTEAVVAKTIRDGSIAAVLDRDAQALTSRAVTDVYVTKEPQQARSFCVMRVECFDRGGARARRTGADETRGDWRLCDEGAAADTLLPCDVC